MNKMVIKTQFAMKDKVYLKKDFVYLKGKYNFIDRESDGVKRSWTCIELVLCFTKSGYMIELWNLQSNDIFRNGVNADDLIPFDKTGE